METHRSADSPDVARQRGSASLAAGHRAWLQAYFEFQAYAGWVVAVLVLLSMISSVVTIGDRWLLLALAAVNTWGAFRVRRLLSEGGADGVGMAAAMCGISFLAAVATRHPGAGAVFSGFGLILAASVWRGTQASAALMASGITPGTTDSPPQREVGMLRVVRNLCTAAGGLTLFVLVSAAIAERTADKAIGIVLGADGNPLARVPVFLDRGSMAIERTVTDSRGAFAFDLEKHEMQRAVWLICAPGGIPMIGSRRDTQIGPSTYQYSAARQSTWGAYRADGWRGPIPRECPTGTDVMGWRYPPSAGRPKYAFTTEEPEWPR